MRRLFLFLSFVGWAAFAPVGLEAAAQTLARSGAQAPPAAPRNQTLKEALLELQRCYKVDILFEEEAMTGVRVPTGLLDRTTTLEKNLKTLLNANGFRFRHLRNGAYVVRRARSAATTPAAPSPPTELEATTAEPAPIPPVMPIPTERLPLPERSVSGRVTDETGAGLPGVNVTVKNSARGTTTGTTGAFRLSVPDDNAVLVFSSVGYQKQEILVGNRTNLAITLKADDQTLNEVVVVGYGKVRRSDLTGSVAQFKNEGANERPAGSIDQLLQGRASGVQLTQTSGAPGAGVSFLIRGASSVTGSNQPLIVLDGYPIESNDRTLTPNSGANQWTTSVPPTNALANINPSDIESIEILKDASATAIYGSRGANGVVLITTKRGKSGRDKVTFSARTDISRLPKKIPMVGTRDYITYANEARLNSGQDSLYKATDIAALANTDINWQDLIYQTAVSQDYQLGFAGGDDKTTYALSTNYTRLQGIIRNSSFDRGSFRLNIDRQVTPRLKLRSSINASMSTNKAAQQANSNGQPSGSTVVGALVFRPIDQPYSGEEDDPNPALSGNPLTLIQIQKDQSRSRLLLLNVAADYKIAEGLFFRFNGGANETTSLREAYLPRGTFQGDAVGGLAYRATASNFNYLLENTLSYDRQVGTRHRINAVLGYTWQSWIQRTAGNQATNFPNDNLGFYAFQIASSSEVPLTNTTQWALASYLGRVNYTFNDRYLITLTGRADGSTRLAAGNKWAFFPSVALGWNLHNEPFMSRNGFVSELKLRGSYGLTGNQAIGVGSTQSALGTIRTTVNGTIVTSLLPSRIGNPDLRWETTRQLNLGADLGMLANRFRLSIEVYRRRITNLLLNQALPGSTGFTTIAANAGEIENKGLEIEAEARLLTAAGNGKLTWTVTGNISFNRNRVLNLNGLQLFGPNYLSVGALGFGQPLHTAVAGEPIGAFFGYRLNGIYQNADEIKTGPTDPSNPTVGSWRYADLNGDNVINANDRTIIGNPYPLYTFGITNDLRWRGFSLSILVMGNLGQQLLNVNRYYTDALALSTGGNVSQRAFDNRWRGEGTSATHARPLAIGPAWRQRFPDFLVEDASFVRLKTLTVAYTLPAEQIRHLVTPKLFVTATNLLTFTRYSGYDPEVSAFATNALTPGVDFGVIPQFRTFSVGLSAGF